jgi:ribosomal protein L1
MWQRHPINNEAMMFITTNLQNKKLPFDVLITDNLSISGIAPYAKKLSTQGKMPKEDLHTLSKAGSSKDMISKYEEFKNCFRKILILRISDKNSILYTSIGNVNDIESAAKNADFLLSELIGMLGNNQNLVLKKKIVYKEIYVKLTMSESIAIGIKK